MNIDTSKFREWLEVIGIFGVIMSLIFVGLEMRQSQEIALSAAYQARADSSMEIRMAALESESLQTANAKLREGQGFESFTPEEYSAMTALMGGNLVYLENMHYQFINGFITKEHWETNRAELRGLLNRDKSWGERQLEACQYFRESFCAEMQAAMRPLAVQ